MLKQATVSRRVTRALQLFLLEQRHLVEKRVAERAMCGALANYLRGEFRGWDVDIEYNRNGDETKRVHSGPRRQLRTVIPDIVIHRQGAEGPNLLAIEVKSGPVDAVPAPDRRKLLAYRQDLGYHFALFIGLRGPTADKPLIVWF